MANIDESARTARLAELENIWRQRFMRQPKLPTSALLTGALAMACGFGAVFFLIGLFIAKNAMSRFTEKWLILASVFGALAILFGVVNRWLAGRWYKEIVVKWDEERKSLKAEIDSLRS